MKNTPKNIAIEKLFPFEGHPFKVKDNEEMNTLIESIQEQGILSPLIVRPKENTEDKSDAGGSKTNDGNDSRSEDKH